MKRYIFNRIMRDADAGTGGGGNPTDVNDGGASEPTELDKLKAVKTGLENDLGKKTGTINLLKEHFGLKDVSADQLEATLAQLAADRNAKEAAAEAERIKSLTEAERIIEERDAAKLERDTFKSENESLKNSKIKSDFTDKLRPELAKANAIDTKMGTAVKVFLIENPDYANISDADISDRVKAWINLSDNLGFMKAPADGGGGGNGGSDTVVSGQSVLQDLQSQFK